MSTIVKNASRPTIRMHALKGSFTDITYFMASLKLSECAEQLHFSRVDEATEFSERVQRRLDEKRADDIFDRYLKKMGHRFFNSLVVVLMPKKNTNHGYFEFHHFTDESDQEIGNVGTLEILTDIERIVVDGQHRLHALRRAEEHTREINYDQKLKLSEIEVPVIFLTFDDVGVNTIKHQIRPNKNLASDVENHSRKVFIDLNKTAKNVDKNSLLILDDSDFSAVAARYLIENDESLERYTKWSSRGTTLADADPYFTNIFLLDQFVEKLFGDQADKISDSYDLSSIEERKSALDEEFLKPNEEHNGLVPSKMIMDFFTQVDFFNEWRNEIQSILGDDPEKQPPATKPNPLQRRKIRDLHQEHLLSTVVGQGAAFTAVVEAFQHFREDDEENNWQRALKRLSDIHKKGLYSRKNNLWDELLVRTGNKMRVNAKERSAQLLDHLIRGVPVEETESIIQPEDGFGTDQTMHYYQEALKELGPIE